MQQTPLRGWDGGLFLSTPKVHDGALSTKLKAQSCPTARPVVPVGCALHHGVERQSLKPSLVEKLE